MCMKRFRILLLFALYGLISTFSHAQNPSVQDVWPVPESIRVQPDAAITITFDQAIMPESVTDESIYVYGRWSGPALGQWDVENDRTTLRFVSERPFMAGELITVVLSKEIQGIDGEPMEAGYAWTFWIRTLPATLEMQEIDRLSTRRPGETFIRSYGAYAGDFNGDGFSDLMIPNEESDDIRIFLNSGTGGYSNFSTYSIPAGDTPSTNEGADFNRDGFVDFAVGNTGNNLVSVWLGGGLGQVDHKENVTAGENIRGLCVLDLDSDGDIDIVTANRTGNENGGNISLLFNDGKGHFDNVETFDDSARGETACAVADANGDGFQDVYIGAYGSDEIVLFLSDGEGNLTRSSTMPVQGNPWMLAAGDVNGDGWPDVVSANSLSRSVSVVLGDGEGRLTSVKHFTVGTFPLAIDLGDLDGDGDLDLVTSNFSSADYTVLENDGQGEFSLYGSLPASRAASCAILHDRDNDGDLDITAIDELDDLVFLYESKTVSTSIEREYSKSPLVEVFPMPFTNTVRFAFSVTDQSELELKLFDVLGREVYRAVIPVTGNSRELYTWDGRDQEGKALPPGVYVYSIQAGSYAQTGHVVKQGH